MKSWTCPGHFLYQRIIGIFLSLAFPRRYNSDTDNPMQRIFTYFEREVSLCGWPPFLFVWIQLLCFCWMNNSFTCLVGSKPVKQEVSHKVILLTQMVSVLCLTNQAGDQLYSGTFPRMSILWLHVLKSIKYDLIFLEPLMLHSHRTCHLPKTATASNFT